MRHSRILAMLLIISGGQAVAADRIAVDLELVLAADTSNSMDEAERRIQVTGYSRAFRDRDVVASILSGPYGRIAVTYVEWSDAQRIIVPWMLISDAASANAFASAVANAPTYQHLDGTNISGALDFGARSIRDNGFDGARCVIDISGDGENNSDTPPDGIRDAIASEGTTINGLPLNIAESRDSYFEKSAEAKLLDQQAGSIEAYYSDHVIGGPGAFLLVANSMRDFGRMIRLKLLREIAAR